MFGHHHGAVNLHAIERSGALQRLREEVANSGVGEMRMAVITREGNEMRGARVVDTIKSSWHRSV